MTIKSMTGFAREAGTSGAHQWAWEIKSVNGRSLEVRVRGPSGLDAVTEAARKLVLGTLARGQCQLTLTLARSAAGASVRINREALRGLLEALAGLDLPETVRPASLDGLLAVRGIVEVEEDGREAFDAALHADLLAGAERLVAQLQAARAEEGRALAGVLSGQLDTMAGLVEAAASHPSRSVEAVRERLQAGVAVLLDVL